MGACGAKSAPAIDVMGAWDDVHIVSSPRAATDAPAAAAPCSARTESRQSSANLIAAPRPSPTIKFTEDSHDLERFGGGSGVRAWKEGGCFALAGPVLRVGTASATFKLDFKKVYVGRDLDPYVYLFQLGLFPADLPLDSSIYSAHGKRCALEVASSGISGYSVPCARVFCDGAMSDDRSCRLWAPGSTVDVRVTFEGVAALVTFSGKRKTWSKTLRDVPACGLRFGAGLCCKGSSVTLAASSIDVGTADAEAKLRELQTAEPVHIGALERVTREARLAGVGEDVLKAAQQVLDEAKERAREAQRAREQARREAAAARLCELQAATPANIPTLERAIENIAALEHAIEEAKAAGVDGGVMVEAAEHALDEARARRQIAAERARAEAGAEAATATAEVAPSGFTERGPGLELVGGTLLPSVCHQTQEDTDAFAFAGPVLRSGTASATFRLDFKRDYVFQIGVFPTDLPLDSDLDSPTMKRCALFLEGSPGCSATTVLCDGVESDATDGFGWRPGCTVDVCLVFDGASARVTFTGKSKSEIIKSETLQNVPACGLRFGAGVYCKGSSVTLVLSSVGAGAGVPVVVAEPIDLSAGALMGTLVSELSVEPSCSYEGAASSGPIVTTGEAL